MILYFAGVGSEVYENFKKVFSSNQQVILFSYYDLTLSGFQFRKRTWEIIVGKRLRRRIRLKRRK